MMHDASTWSRSLTTVLTAAVALAAIAGGALLVVAPSGRLLGMDCALLAGTPFPTFLVPGLALFFAVGGSAFAATIALFRRAPLAPASTIIAGFMLIAWMSVQLQMLGKIHALQPAMLATGAVVLLLGLYAYFREEA
jgi:hypothetical protein